MNAYALSVIFGCMFLIGSAEVVTGPMMVAMAGHFDVRVSSIAYLPAAYGLAYAVVATFAGPLSDRIGRKRPLQWGLTGFGLLTAAIPLAPGLGVAVVLSALTGGCAAMMQPNALALVGDHVPAEKAGRYFGRVFIGLMLAFILTPVLSGTLADTVGWAAAYYGLSLGALVLAIGAYRLRLPETIAADLTGASVDAPSFRATHRRALATKDLRPRILASYLWLGGVAGFGALVAEVCVRKMGLSPSAAGLLAGIYGVAVITGNLLSSPIRRWLGPAALPLFALVSALGIAAFLLPCRNLAELALVGLPWAFAYGCAGPLHHAALSSLSERYRGTINSYHASLLNLGIFSVALFMGKLNADESFLTVFCLGVSAFSTLGALMLFRKGRPAGTP